MHLDSQAATPQEHVYIHMQSDENAANDEVDRSNAHFLLPKILDTVLPYRLISSRFNVFEWLSNIHTCSLEADHGHLYTGKQNAASAWLDHPFWNQTA